MTIDIDAIRQRAERYSQTGIGSGKTIQAIDLANKDVPALLAKVDELGALLGNRVVEEIADELGREVELERERDAALAKVDELTAEREHMELNPTGTAEWLKNRVNELTAELAAKNAVIDAAKTWRRAVAETGDYEISDSDVLIAAVDALPKGGAR